MGDGADVARPRAVREFAEQRLAQVRVEDRPGEQQAQRRQARGEARERPERQQRALDHPDAGGEHDEERARRQREAPGEVEALAPLEPRRLRHDHEPSGEVGQRGRDARGGAGVERGDPRRAVEHAAHDGRARRIEEVVVRVGPRERHHDRQLGAARQPERERPHAVGVEGVDQRRPPGVHLGLDGVLRRHRQIPHPERHAPGLEAARDPRDGHRVAAHGRVREGGQEGQTEGHRSRAYRQARAASSRARNPSRPRGHPSL